MQRYSKKNLQKIADINTGDLQVTYFPYPECTIQIGYSCGQCGCTGMLYRGLASGCLYADGPFSSGTNLLYGKLGAREQSIIDRLSHFEVIENGVQKAVGAFVARDGSRFTVATSDFGKTWQIVG